MKSRLLPTQSDFKMTPLTAPPAGNQRKDWGAQSPCPWRGSFSRHQEGTLLLATLQSQEPPRNKGKSQLSCLTAGAARSWVLLPSGLVPSACSGKKAAEPEQLSRP